MDTKGLLRGLLRKHDTDLSDILERQWEIAWNEWLPAFGVDVGKQSFNSSPHLRNIERHLDEILAMRDEAGNFVRLQIDLAPVEIYVLLAAVLFHDIGRWTATGNHGQASWECLDKFCEALGFPSKKMAHCVGRVCRFHSPPKEEDEDPRSRSRYVLSTTTIDPHGRIREEVVAALLFLADNMDSAFTRVLPDYLLAGKTMQGVAAFRSAIRGVRVDWSARMVCTALGNLVDKSRSELLPREILVGSESLASLRKRRKTGRHGEPHPPAIASAVLAAPEVWVFEQNALEKGVRFTVALDNPNKAWPGEACLVMAMSDVGKNARDLAHIHLALSSLGMPLRAWLLEYQDRLFNSHGAETFEPVFSKDYLRETARSMWDISTHVFGVSQFTYLNLADAMMDPNVEKVRRAVKRIERVTLGMDGGSPAIWAGDDHWKWNCRIEHENASCRLASLASVDGILDNLGVPHD